MTQYLLCARQLLVKLVQWLLMLMILTMTCVMFAQIIWRYLLQSPLVWSEELALLLMVWMTFLGSALMLERKEHVAIDLLVEWLPPSLNRVMQIIGALVVLTFNVALTYGALLIVETAREAIMPGLKISSACLRNLPPSLFDPSSLIGGAWNQPGPVGGLVEGHHTGISCPCIVFLVFWGP